MIEVGIDLGEVDVYVNIEVIVIVSVVIVVFEVGWMFFEVINEDISWREIVYGDVENLEYEMGI